MGRLSLITALALLLVVPVWAQRGGGHFGGGRAGGFAGHSGFSGGHFGGTHFGGGRFSRGIHRGFSGGFRSRGFSRGRFRHNGFQRHRFRNFAFDNDCRGFGCGTGFFPGWGGYYDPWLWDWWNDDYSFDQDYERNLEIANQMNQQSLEQQRMLRQEEADGDQDSYARSRPPRANSETIGEQPSSPAVPTVLVFRDQHQKEVLNYAIIGQTLWNFSAQHTEKIPLSDLDLAATAKVNDDRGVTFSVPEPNSGQ